MTITQRTFGEAVVLEFGDEFTYAARKLFTNAVEKVKQTGTGHLILNFHQVTFVDSAALGLLALAAQQFAAENRLLSLVSPQGTVKQILEFANIHKMLAVFPSEEDATGRKAA